MHQPAPSARDLAAAVERSELQLAYQPQIELASGNLCRVEVLARWQHPGLGFVPPSTFVPIAESGELIDALTQWIVRTALRQAAEWQSRGLFLELALNVSPLNLSRLDFPDLIESLCAEHQVRPQQLTIEITEGASQELVALMDNLSRLRLKGVNLSLDDFGTGYSSIMQLHQLPFSEIKIDKCFVSDIHVSTDSQIVSKAMIDLAHALGLEAVGEGVECQQALLALTELGCDKAQGYHIAKPMSGADLPLWIEMRSVAVSGRNEVTLNRPEIAGGHLA